MKKQIRRIKIIIWKLQIAIRVKLIDRFREKYLVLITWRLHNHCFQNEWILTIFSKLSCVPYRTDTQSLKIRASFSQILFSTTAATGSYVRICNFTDQLLVAVRPAKMKIKSNCLQIMPRVAHVICNLQFPYDNFDSPNMFLHWKYFPTSFIPKIVPSVLQKRV